MACEGGDGTSCLLDSDCADFSHVCIEDTCRPAGELPDAGAPRDGSTRDAGRVDSGTGTDGGPRDSGTTDAGGPVDAGDGGVMNCEDVTGSWTISFVNSPGSCGDAMTSYGVTIGSGASSCEFAARSTESTMPALDGTFTLDMANAVLGMMMTGVSPAVTCNGNFNPAGEQFTFICGSCVMNLNRL